MNKTILLVIALLIVSFSHSDAIKESIIDLFNDFVFVSETEVDNCNSITIEFKVVIREYWILQVQ